MWAESHRIYISLFIDRSGSLCTLYRLEVYFPSYEYLFHSCSFYLESRSSSFKISFHFSIIVRFLICLPLFEGDKALHKPIRIQSRQIDLNLFFQIVDNEQFRKLLQMLCSDLQIAHCTKMTIMILSHYKKICDKIRLNLTESRHVFIALNAWSSS